MSEATLPAGPRASSDCASELPSFPSPTAGRGARPPRALSASAPRPGPGRVGAAVPAVPAAPSTAGLRAARTRSAGAAGGVRRRQGALLPRRARGAAGPADRGAAGSSVSAVRAAGGPRRGGEGRSADRTARALRPRLQRGASRVACPGSRVRQGRVPPSLGVGNVLNTYHPGRHGVQVPLPRWVRQRSLGKLREAGSWEVPFPGGAGLYPGNGAVFQRRTI